MYPPRLCLRLEEQTSIRKIWKSNIPSSIKEPPTRTPELSKIDTGYKDW